MSRALKLIDNGGLARRGVDELAADLGIGARQLRRLFARHVGASPLAVAHTRRLQFAKKLVDETRLPMTQVAQAAGYSSIRRFNASFLEVYGRSPRDLRRESRDSDRSIAAGELELELAFRGAYDWPAMLAFLEPRCTPGVERIEGEAYVRTVRVAGRTGWLTATVAPALRHLTLRLFLSSADRLFDAVRRARLAFDLDADPELIEEDLGRDPIVGPLVRSNPGLRVPGAWDPFELSVRAILGQQVSIKAATTLAGRLVERWGERVRRTPGGLTHVFPTPERLTTADLRSIGLPRDRAETIRLVAAAFRDGRLFPRRMRGLRDVLDGLTAIPGIGDWTAQYVAMRAYGEPDAFPAGDLGLRKVLSSTGRPIATARVREMSQAWRPWRAVAAMHLWAALGEAPVVPVVTGRRRTAG